LFSHGFYGKKAARLNTGRCSSVVERIIGNDEVGSSILPSGTIFLFLYFLF
jgi:hypothetical protein